jgi:hypothetical protein
MGYINVAHDITHYDIGFVKDIVKRLAKRNRCRINMRRALGLANPAKLQLTSEERKLLLRTYNHTINFMLEKLFCTANFYERYQIIYTKSKHGLTIQTGHGWFGDNDLLMAAQFDRPLLVCYDRKKDLLDMPSGTREMSSCDIHIGDYYNVLALLRNNSGYAGLGDRNKICM